MTRITVKAEGNTLRISYEPGVGDFLSLLHELKHQIPSFTSDDNLERIIIEKASA